MKVASLTSVLQGAHLAREMAHGVRGSGWHGRVVMHPSLLTPHLDHSSETLLLPAWLKGGCSQCTPSVEEYWSVATQAIRKAVCGQVH